MKNFANGIVLMMFYPSAILIVLVAVCLELFAGNKLPVKGARKRLDDMSDRNMNICSLLAGLVIGITLGAVARYLL